MCAYEVADPPLSAKRPLNLLAAFPVPGESVTINQFQTCIYWVKLQVPDPINPEHLIVEVTIVSWPKQVRSNNAYS